MEIDLSPYIAQEKAEEIFRDCCNDQIKEFLRRHCAGSPSEIGKLVGFGIESIIEDIAEESGVSLRKQVQNKIPKIIRNLSEYDLFYTKDSFVHQQDSVGRQILNEELLASRDVIYEKINQVLNKYNWNLLTEDAMTDVLYTVIRDRLFGKEDK